MNQLREFKYIITRLDKWKAWCRHRGVSISDTRGWFFHVGKEQYIPEPVKLCKDCARLDRDCTGCFIKEKELSESCVCTDKVVL